MRNRATCALVVAIPVLARRRGRLVHPGLSAPQVRTTLTIDEDVLRWVKIRAARSGKGDSAVIEESLRRDLGLDLLDRLWARNELPENEATALAVEAQHKTRPKRR